MFDLGFSELLVIFAVALLVFGPEKLPTFARTLGRTAAKLRRAVDEVTKELNLPNVNVRSELQKFTSDLAKDFPRTIVLPPVDAPDEHSCAHCHDEHTPPAEKDVLPKPERSKSEKAV